MESSFTVEDNPPETTRADSNTKQFDDLLHEDYAQDIKLKKAVLLGDMHIDLRLVARCSRNGSCNVNFS